MYKLEPDDIKSMLRDAARVLTQPNDRETVQRLYQSMMVTQPDNWDKRLIASLLAKAGKLHEAEIVAYDLEIGWQRAEALCRMAETMFEGGDPNQALGLLHAAAMEATKGQESGSPHDQLDSAAVLGEVAVVYATQKDLKTARQLIEAIADIQRRESAFEKVAQLAGAEETEAEAPAAPEAKAKKPAVAKAKSGTATKTKKKK